MMEYNIIMSRSSRARAARGFEASDLVQHPRSAQGALGWFPGALRAFRPPASLQSCCYILCFVGCMFNHVFLASKLSCICLIMYIVYIALCSSCMFNHAAVYTMMFFFRPPSKLRPPLGCPCRRGRGPRQVFSAVAF